MSEISTKSKLDRRSFLKVSALAGGGLMIGFNWGFKPITEAEAEVAEELKKINAFIKIASDGRIIIMSPNPEIGQNVKTSMPMIVAEELDVDWKDVVVEQAPLNTDLYTRQVAGGSQSIRQGWESLRMAGATGRKMMINAAAKKWNIGPAKLRTENSHVIAPDGTKAYYGELADTAAEMEVPDTIELKDPKDFKIIGTRIGNVDMEGIITGKPLFGIDFRREGMKTAAALRPPAFGMKLESFDDTETRKVNGVVDVVQFGDKIAVIADNTWAAFKGKKALRANWVEDGMLESTEYHNKKMDELLYTQAEEPRRSDGNVKEQFDTADKIVEKVYKAPFLPHNPLEPQNFFAHVTDEKVELVGPIQTPEWTRSRVAELLSRDEKDIHIDMTRMGGGFGRRLYGDFALEAAEISKISKRPIHLIFTREDDMTAGIYRPASKYRFKAAIKDGKLTAYQLVGVGINMGNSTREHNFPASTLDHYLVESHNLESNITTGAWRAPITNFLAFAEQSFFDELAEEMGKDPVDLRLELLQRAVDNPVGELDYEPEKMIGVIKLAAEKSGWYDKPKSGVHRGFSCYYSHNSYVAEVAEVNVSEGYPKIERVVAASDCGIVINPVGAENQVEGGVIDGVGHAMYGYLGFEEGKPQQNNFNNYRLIRTKEAPKVEPYFVKSTNNPTGLGEPALPPAAGAVANAIYRATGQRLYKQPFDEQLREMKVG